MLEALQFIFSGFWVWLGSLLLLCAFGQAMAAVICALRGNR